MARSLEPRAWIVCPARRPNFICTRGILSAALIAPLARLLAQLAALQRVQWRHGLVRRMTPACLSRASTPARCTVDAMAAAAAGAAAGVPDAGAGGGSGGGEEVPALGAAGSVPRAADFRYSMEYLPHGHRYTLNSFRVNPELIGCGKFGA